MNTMKKILPLALCSTLFFAACSKKEDVTQEDVDAAVANADAKNQEKLDEMQSDNEAALAAQAAEMDESLAAQQEMMDEKLKGQLAKQANDLRAEFETSNSELKAQLESLTKKYNALEDKLPEEVVETVSAKLPELQGSLSNLETLTNEFSPSSLEQLNEFKTKYQKELSAAKNIADELLGLFGKNSLSDLMPNM